MQYGLVDKDKIIIKKERDFVEEDRQDVKKVIENIIIEYIEEILKKERYNISDIESIGIASPGGNRDGVIIKAENLGIEDFNIVGILKKYFNYENIFLRNDAKCAALCEKEFGSLKKYDDCIFICLGTGIGGAVFIDEKLLRAKKYEGFELRTYYYR